MLFETEQSDKDQQAYIPAIESKRKARREIVPLSSRDLSRMVQFDPKLISSEDYDEYMNFVEAIWGHSGRGLLQNRFSMDNALKILHKAKYNLARAKFYIQFPVLYQMEVFGHEEEGGKRKSLEEIPNADLATYLDQYYEGLKKNKSNAEMRWLQSVKQTLAAEIKYGREIRRLQNEANFSKFEMPLELKLAIELENKLSADITQILSLPQKDTGDILRLFNKCNEQNYRPSYFEKLETEVEYIKALNEECNDATGKLMTYSELKTFFEKLTPFKPTADFKALQERYNKAASLKASISSFLKSQNFKTRGGSQEDKIDIKKAVEILDASEKLKVNFDNLDKFKERLSEIINLISEVDAYIESDNNIKSIEVANKYLEALLNTGLEAPQILKLNQIKDYLDQIDIVEKNIQNLDAAEENKRILEHLFKVGFITTLGEKLMEQCNLQIKWKRSLIHFQNIPDNFSVELFMEGRLPTLIDITYFNELIKIPPSITVSQEVKNLLDAHKYAYSSTRKFLPHTALKDKLKIAKDIYSSKIVDSDKLIFLKSLQEELKFTMEVAAIMTALNQTNEIAPLQKIFDHPIQKAKQVNLTYIERFLSDNAKFNSLMAYNVLNTQVSRMKEIVAQANEAIAKDDFKAITRLEEELRDNLACQDVYRKLLDCVEFAAWKEDSIKLVSAVEIRKNRELMQMCQKLEEETTNLDFENQDDICRWYHSKRSILKNIYPYIGDYESFERYEKLSKLVHDEKNFAPGKDDELRLQLKAIKAHVDQIDNAISLLGEFATEFVLPIGLGYLGKAYCYGIRTKNMSELSKKIIFAVESELEVGPISAIDSLEEKLSLFSHLGLWTPHVAKLKALKNWYKKSDEISEKVIARVTRQRIHLMSEVLDTMLHNTEDFEPKVYPEIFEISIRRKEKEDNFNFRPRREKKKNQFYVSRAFDSKPLKTGKELIEDIIFNDLVEPTTKLCICNRGKRDLNVVGFFRMIQCDFCLKWFHIDCLRFNKSSLNKIKQFECPGCSLTRNTDYQRSIEILTSERSSLTEIKTLVNELRTLSLQIKLGANQQDIIMYYNRYTEIVQGSEHLAKQLDNFIEKSQEVNFNSEVVRSQVLSIVGQLKEYLIQLIGLPFFSPSIEGLTLVLRKYHLIARVYFMKEKKRVDLSDLYFIDAMKVGQSLKSDFLQKNVSHGEEVLENLAKIEELDHKMLPFPEYKKNLEKLLKHIKYNNLIEKKQKLVENWPSLEESTRLQLANPRHLTVRLYKEQLAFFEKLPFVNDFPDLIRQRLKTIETWREQVRTAQNSSLNISEIQRLTAMVQGILSPSDPELTWLNAILQTSPFLHAIPK